MKFCLSLFAISTFLSFTAHAKTTVVLFGGWGSTPQDMATWQLRANKSAYAGDYQFFGVPYPDGVGFGSDDALNSESGQALVAKYVRMIQAARKKDPAAAFVVAGHSSASPLAFAVASKLAQLPRPEPDYHVKFANLDGFNSPRSRFPSLCVQGRNNVTTCSKSYRQPAGKCLNAALPWCLHFSIVNKNVTKSTSIATGYKDLEPNLKWLERLDGAEPRDSESHSQFLEEPEDSPSAR